MFIYEYMAGLAETLGGGESHENYDPYENRKVPHPTTYTETMIHLLKGSIGAGILAMPQACKRVGVILALVGIISLGLFATYCLQLLIYSEYEICKRQKRGYIAYNKAMRLAVLDGPKCMRCMATMFYYGVDSMLILWQLGVCSIYLVFVGVNMKQVLDYHGMILSVRWIITYSLPLQILLNLVKILKYLTPLSTFSNLVTLIGMSLVFFYLIEDDIELDNDKLLVKNINEIPYFIGITLFAMEAVGVVLALEYNIDNPRTFVGVCGLLSRGMMIILGLFAALGLTGYLKYGDDTKDSITLNLPPDQKKAQAAQISFALALFFSFPLQNYVAYELLWRKLVKRFRNKMNKCWDYTLRILLVLIPFSAAIAVPNLGPFISLMGALCLSLLAIIFPGVMDLCICYPNQYGKLYFKLFRDLFIIVSGTFCLFSGVYVSVQEMYATHSTV